MKCSFIPTFSLCRPLLPSQQPQSYKEAAVYTECAAKAVPAQPLRSITTGLCSHIPIRLHDAAEYFSLHPAACLPKLFICYGRKWLHTLVLHNVSTNSLKVPRAEKC